MFLTIFLAVLAALVCHTLFFEGIMFFLQYLAIQRHKKFNSELLAKYPDLLTNSAKYMPFYRGYEETTSSGTERKYDHGSGQYL